MSREEAIYELIVEVLGREDAETFCDFLGKLTDGYEPTEAEAAWLAIADRKFGVHSGELRS